MGSLHIAGLRIGGPAAVRQSVVPPLGWLRNACLPLPASGCWLISGPSLGPSPPWNPNSATHPPTHSHPYPTHDAHAQVVWRSTTEVGCGMAMSPWDNRSQCIIVTCRYRPPGNIAGNEEFADNVRPKVSP